MLPTKPTLYCFPWKPRKPKFKYPFVNSVGSAVPGLGQKQQNQQNKAGRLSWEGYRCAKNQDFKVSLIREKSIAECGCGFGVWLVPGLEMIGFAVLGHLEVIKPTNKLTCTPYII